MFDIFVRDDQIYELKNRVKDLEEENNKLQNNQVQNKKLKNLINIFSTIETPESSKKNNDSAIKADDRRYNEWRFKNLEPYTKIDGTPDYRFKINTKIPATNWVRGRKQSRPNYEMSDDE